MTWFETHHVNMSDEDPSLREIPQYVLDYAPYCYLYSYEEYWPGLMDEHLHHTTPYRDYDPLPEEFWHLDLDNLDVLNDQGNRSVYLTSNDDPESYPHWLSGEENIPDQQEEKLKNIGGKPGINGIPYKSAAPVILIVVDKGSYVDAFWFFFYSFNLGNQVLGVRFGNHVGDWEHTMVRFNKRTGKPESVFFSEHEWGSGYDWEDCEKSDMDEKRMFTYSGFGTHAMYRTAGIHRYVLPFGLLQDITDRGPIWDPLLNMYSYTYDFKKDIIRASNITPDAPENWFYYRGQWGDKVYPMSDRRQYRFAGELHYVSGPTGPWKKNLGRKGPCQGRDEYRCLVIDDVEAKDRLPRILSKDEVERWKRRMAGGDPEIA